MPKLRRLSGAEIIAILGRFGFTVHSQRGSHVKLRRVSPDPSPAQPIRAGRGPAATLLFRLTRPPASPSARHPSVVDAGEEPGGAVMAEPAERAALELHVPLVLEKGALDPPLA